MEVICNPVSKLKAPRCAVAVCPDVSINRDDRHRFPSAKSLNWYEKLRFSGASHPGMLSRHVDHSLHSDKDSESELVSFCFRLFYKHFF